MSTAENINLLKNSIAFSSKANVLLQLLQYDTLNIPPVFVLDYHSWCEKKADLLKEISHFAHCHKNELAVRSSCSKEDSQEESGAGAFTSLLNIDAKNIKSLKNAIDTVFASYGGALSADQVLIQPMVKNVQVSGVIMTKSLDDGSPYYVINYDDESGKTDTITAGLQGSKSVYIYRDAQDSDFDSKRLLSFMNLAKKVEKLCKRNDLDLEFCQDTDGKIYLLQVRPICAKQHWIASSTNQVRSNIDFIVDFMQNRTQVSPFLYGKSTILGVMPDWNPAEIIGITPRPLASSLYRELITKSVWREARESMGYRKMPPEELMIMLANRPYIDVRVSFNSFLPEGLDGATSEVLVSAWLDYLDKNPSLHDKVEFDVAQTILDFSFEENMQKRYPHTLSAARKGEFRLALQKLTNKCLDMSEKGSVAKAFDQVIELQNRQSSYIDYRNLEAHTLLSHLTLLCEDCKKLGTLPFSVLARHAFIAETLLRTAVERGALTKERLAEFKNSLKTVAGEMSQDFIKVCQGNMPKENFIRHYGHLRPSTYDILSPCYAKRDTLFNHNQRRLKEEKEILFELTKKESQAISSLMQESGLNGTAETLFAYAKKVIPGREWAKFVFSYNLSHILELITLWGKQIGFDREELSYLDFRDILEWSSHALLEEPKKYFEEKAHKGQRLFELSKSLKLGYLIRSPRDIYVVPQHRSAPNFTGKGSIEGRIVSLSASSDCSVEMEGAIVCIENADPGFDWIFTRNIGGLVTKFGGTNSHMAIRCAEYGLPAAIGVGDVLFESISNAQMALLNSDTHTLQVI